MSVSDYTESWSPELDETSPVKQKNKIVYLLCNVIKLRFEQMPEIEFYDYESTIIAHVLI